MNQKAFAVPRPLVQPVRDPRCPGLKREVPRLLQRDALAIEHGSSIDIASLDHRRQKPAHVMPGGHEGDRRRDQKVADRSTLVTVVTELVAHREVGLVLERWIERTPVHPKLREQSLTHVLRERQP